MPPTLTFAESGIVDKSQISVVETSSNDNSAEEESEDNGHYECEGFKYNIFFRDTRGHEVIISINGEHSLPTLLKKYLAKSGISEEISKKNLDFI